MDIKEFDKVPGSKILDFIKLCYEKIGRTMDTAEKDSDLLHISHEYVDSGGNFFVLVDNEGKITGTIAIKFLYSPKGYIGEVHRFYVHPEFQKKGYGSTLLMYISRYAQERGATYLRGTTEYRLKDAIGLLKSVGAYEIPQYRESRAEAFFEWKIPENAFQYDFSEFSKALKESLAELEQRNKRTLILNPVENYPNPDILFPCASPIHGLYNTDSQRSDEEKLLSKIQFAGRDSVTRDVHSIYQQWAKLLGAQALTMRLLSGLHAHIILFMAITKIGDRVLLLPEIAGGHMATKAILQRLGLEVEEFPVDKANHCIDIPKSQALIDRFHPKIIFVDRSEGLIYEDFSWMNQVYGPLKIFDASQYLTNVIAGDYMNPFEMGFDYILSTTHKNLPGPQRALICCKNVDENWYQLKAGISKYVSNMHFHSIYSAGLILEDFQKLRTLSQEMLTNTMLLNSALQKRGVCVIQRNVTSRSPNTHHIWVSAPSQKDAFQWYMNLEKIGVLVNYRKLPYELGYGLRLGLSAATYRGLRAEHIDQLATIVSSALQGPSKQLGSDLQMLLRHIDGRTHE